MDWSTEVFLKPDTINSYETNELMVHDASIIFERAKLKSTPIHFECNDGTWVCVEGE